MSCLYCVVRVCVVLVMESEPWKTKFFSKKSKFLLPEKCLIPWKKRPKSYPYFATLIKLRGGLYFHSVWKGRMEVFQKWSVRKEPGNKNLGMVFELARLNRGGTMEVFHLRVVFMSPRKQPSAVNAGLTEIFSHGTKKWVEPNNKTFAATTRQTVWKRKRIMIG